MNRKRYGVAQAADLHDHIHVVQAQTTNDIAGILQGFKTLNIDIVVIDGGDGTVREVLSQCPAVFGKNLPMFCVLPSGKTNVVAHNTGTAKYKREAFNCLLERLKTGLEAQHIVSLPVMRVVWGDASHEPVLGTLVGFAGFRAATDLAQTNVHSKGLNHNVAVVTTIVSFFYGAVFGRDDEGVRAGEKIAVDFDGVAEEEQNHFGVILTTLNNFVMGVWPFWGDNSKAIKWLDIKAPPRNLVWALLMVFSHRGSEKLKRDGFESGSAQTVHIKTAHDFIIDGETFSPGADGKLEITSGVSVDFIAP